MDKLTEALGGLCFSSIGQVPLISETVEESGFHSYDSPAEIEYVGTSIVVRFPRYF